MVSGIAAHISGYNLGKRGVAATTVGALFVAALLLYETAQSQVQVSEDVATIAGFQLHGLPPHVIHRVAGYTFNSYRSNLEQALEPSFSDLTVWTDLDCWS